MLWDFDAMMGGVLKTLTCRLFPEKRVFLCQTYDR